MPQMMPINWITIFFMNYTLLFAVIISINSFNMSNFCMFQMPGNSKKLDTFKTEWKW
uniref:ATP synthase F0 subunit 8 n=1 Tax=Tetragonula iridipennis TaxID=597212 RepID=UPI0026E24698|nr:ATP synthase F0 subunit 8 [Tetragonula iridipennis]WJQ22757.1 ATP synthase subunit 8 [Tetragonula iridipennis]